MSETTRQRAVARVDSPAFGSGHADNHRVRPLMPPGDWKAHDPFLLLMEDVYGPKVFSPHPHRGIQTLTYLIDGELEHYDNHGASAVIAPGDALLLTAGRGIVHDERPATGGQLHILQLWINLPRADKLVPAALHALRSKDLPVIREPGVEARVFSGSAGDVTASTPNHTPFTFVDLRLAGASFEQSLPPDFNAFVVPLEGVVQIGPEGQRVEAGQIAWLERCEGPSHVRLASSASAHALIVAGKPLREPVAARGPFVMNTAAELDEAYAEFRSRQLEFGK
jgi:redox-sensitive bicupin YhaK (pirin superfamily)